jgi:hypothetical protein
MPTFNWDIASAVALLFSLYNFWQHSQKPAQLRLFVPPVINYALPYQNSNFEMFAVPVTVINQGARTGTILSMNLAVTDLQSKTTKQFYSASLGKWSVEKAQNGDFEPFAPVSLAGRVSHTDTIQFYTRGEKEPTQILQNPGRYRFTITIDTPTRYNLFARLLGKEAEPLAFEMVLAHPLDHRAFNHGSGTIALHNENWKSSTNA